MGRQAELSGGSLYFWIQILIQILGVDMCGCVCVPTTGDEPVSVRAQAKA